MAYRDASRITIDFPAFDDAGGVGATFTACVFDGPNWSGFERPATETTCSSDTADDWGNLVRTYGQGTVVDMGTLDLTVDWDIDNVGETSGPIITFAGVLTNFSPQGTVLGTEDEARFAASVTIQISGDLTFTAPV